MEKNEKELKTSKYRSYFIMKVLLFVLCVTNVVLLAVVVKDFASLRFKQQDEYFGKRTDLWLEVFEKRETRPGNQTN